MNKSVPSQIGVDPVNSGDVQTEYNNAEISYKGLEPAYVEKAMISSNAEDSFLVKLLTRQTRTPEIGDKFSSRHGQKGVIGMIIQIILHRIHVLRYSNVYYSCVCQYKRFNNCIQVQLWLRKICHLMNEEWSRI